jgi:hypothetical protein
MAGLGSYFGYPQVSNWFDPRRGQFLALASGLASSPDFGQAVSNGFRAAAAAKPADDAYAASLKADQERQAQINQTKQWIAKNYPQYADLPASEGFQLALQDLRQNSAAGGNPPSFSQTPVFLTDGKNVHAAQMSSGGGIYVDGKTLPGIPEGWSVVARPDNLSNVNLGGSMAVFDPNTGTYKTGPAIQGSPSSDMDVTVNPNGSRTMTPATGSDAALKRRGNQTAAQTSLMLLEQKQGLVSQKIDHALQLAQSAPATGIFSLANAVPGTPQYDLKTTLDTIKANVGFDQLQQMRDSSPTGGALGQVSEQENRLLQSVLGSLDQAQSLQQFVDNLQMLKQILANSTDARRRAFAQDFPDSAASASGPGAGKTLTYNPATGELE